MPLKTVTVTGADDNTAIGDLLDLFERFPFAEFGILIGSTTEPRPRFPSELWLVQLAIKSQAENLRLSLHICGKYVRDFLHGYYEDVFRIVTACNFKRVQVNTHGTPHQIVPSGLLKALEAMTSAGVETIFQRDGVNNTIFDVYSSLQHLNVSTLFDTSAGAGRTPDQWPEYLNTPSSELRKCGYAGGLSPYNLDEQLPKIEEASFGNDYWIDAEGRLRTLIGRADTVVDVLDIGAVELFLERASKYIRVL